MSDRVLRRRVSVPNYEKIYAIHGFYVRQLSTNSGERPYFVYESLPEYMGGQPSNRVLQYVNHERCDDFIDDWENMEAILMLDGPSRAIVVIHTISAQANDYRWRARRNPRPQQVERGPQQVEHSNEDEDDHEENHDGEVNINRFNNPWRTVRPYWDL